MITDLVEVNQENPDPEVIRRVATLIRKGVVAAIPSDSLYMLIADPFNLNAVGKVFAAKGRESTRSLPLLVNDMIMVEELTPEITRRFHLLARRFWPGPLTVIVPAGSKVPLKITGNTGRLALRHTRSAIGSAIIDFLGQPLIATSANMSGVPTCASGIEVFGTMDGRLDLAVDGGHCVGTGATTIDITEPYWRIIKQGAIEEREIAEVLKGS
ncbi:MAG: threonylcarbamoyl-AMP synthase [Acidobacteria bacterium]|nr:threonylcarbamoyl-AMP synthase [Acidobacteriota bacterium]